MVKLSKEAASVLNLCYIQVSFDSHALEVLSRHRDELGSLYLGSWNEQDEPVESKDPIMVWMQEVVDCLAETGKTQVYLPAPPKGANVTALQRLAGCQFLSDQFAIFGELVAGSESEIERWNNDPILERASTKGNLADLARYIRGMKKLQAWVDEYASRSSGWSIVQTDYGAAVFAHLASTPRANWPRTAVLNPVQ